MTDGYALLRAIEANPDEDTPRLAYADWLDEQGDAPRAEFIRLQCGGAEVVRQKELFYARADKWIGELPGHQFNHICVRGFLDPVCTDGWDFVRHAAAYAAVAPLHHVRLYQSPRAVEKLAALPELRFVRFLNLASNVLRVSHAQKLLASPHLGNLRAINFESNHVGQGGCRALAAADLPALEAVVLDSNTIGGPGLEALLGAAWFPRLKKLSAHGCNLTGSSVAALTRSPAAAGLESLNLGCAFKVPATTLELLADGVFRGLRVLRLYSCNLTDRVIERLAASPGMANVRELDISGTRGFSPGAALALLESPHFRHLQRLTMTTYGLDAATRAAFDARLGDGFNPTRVAPPWYE